MSSFCMFWITFVHSTLVLTSSLGLIKNLTLDFEQLFGFTSTFAFGFTLKQITFQAFLSYLNFLNVQETNYKEWVKLELA